MELEPASRGIFLEAHPNREIAAITAERVYVLPHPALRRTISHYTVFSPAGGTAGTPETLHIVPDASGCIVCEVTRRRITPLLWGPMSRVASVSHNPSRPTLIIFAEFLPCGANRLLRIPLHRLENITVPLEDVEPQLALEIADSASHWFHGRRMPHHHSFIDDLDRLFLSRLSAAGDSLLACHVVAAVTKNRGSLRLGELARQTGYSERHINRVMLEALGLGVKSLSRIVRINCACRDLLVSRQTLTAVAHNLEYHDQAHFIRDFKSICGVTPGQYQNDMSDFYNEELKMAGTMPSK